MNIPVKKQRNPGSSVDPVIERLLTDPRFALEAIVRNNAPAVAARYEAITGRAAPATVEALVSKLVDMRAAGQKSMAAQIATVPWVRSADPNNVLDQAWTALQSEASSLADPANPNTVWKNQPTTGSGGFDDSDYGSEGGNPAAPSTGSNADAGNGGATWVADTVALLNSMSGVIGVLTGNTPNSNATAASGGTPQPATNWLKVALVGIGITAAIVVVVLLVKAMRK